jgi:hypothetical protein
MDEQRPARYTELKVRLDKLPEYIEAAQLLRLHYLVKSDQEVGYEPPLLYLFLDRLAMEQYMRGEHSEED